MQCTLSWHVTCFDHIPVPYVHSNMARGFGGAPCGSDDMHAIPSCFVETIRHLYGWPFCSWRHRNQKRNIHYFRTSTTAYVQHSGPYTALWSQFKISLSTHLYAQYVQFSGLCVNSFSFPVINEEKKNADKCWFCNLGHVFHRVRFFIYSPHMVQIRRRHR